MLSKQFHQKSNRPSPEKACDTTEVEPPSEISSKLTPQKRAAATPTSVLYFCQIVRQT
jgi:hypothetical protein